MFLLGKCWIHVEKNIIYIKYNIEKEKLYLKANLLFQDIPKPFVRIAILSRKECITKYKLKNNCKYFSLFTKIIIKKIFIFQKWGKQKD